MRVRVRWPRSWLCGLALASIAASATAQKPLVEQFTVDSGLPSATIFDLDQDDSGRLWIVNRGGVTVYDGRSFHTFGPEDGLPSRTLRSLAIDDGGQVWVTTRISPEVFFLDDSTWKSLPPPPESFAEQDIVTSLAVVGRGDQATVYLATMANGLLVWRQGAWTKLGTDEGLPSDQVHALVPHLERIAVATSAGLCLLEDLKLDCRIQIAEPRLGNSILAASSLGDAGLWLLGQSWVGHVHDGQLRVVAEDLDLETLDATIPGSVVADTAGSVYFGNSAIAFYIDAESGQIRRLGKRQGLAAEGATALLTDRESNVWVGSLRGLNRLVSWRFESYDRDDGLLESEVSAIAETADGHLVLGHNSGLSFFDGERFETVSFNLPRSQVFSHRVLDMAVDDEGTVWIAAQKVGLLRVTSAPSWTTSMASERPLSVEWHTREGLWIATREALFHRQGSRFVRVDVGLNDSETLRWLHIADDGRVFAGGLGGLRWREGKEWRVARGPIRTANSVFTVFTSPEAVWVGTGAGLYRLDGDDLVQVRKGDLVIDRPVFLIFRDPDGRMWFGTDGDVVVWDGREARHLTAEYGLIGRETNRGAGWVDRQGRVWIGTDKGMSMYRKRFDTRSTAAPLVRVRNLDANGESWPAQEQVQLSHRQRNLTFRFDAVSLSRGDDLLFRHQLEGFDDDWLGPFPLSAGEVRYANLPPGDYRFAVTAGWADGTWSPEARSAPIVITGPFWRQAWFYGLAAMAIGLGIPGVYSLRTRAIRKRNAELEALNLRLNTHIEEREGLISELEIKNQELERFTYTVSHDLKSPLVTIKGFLGYLKKHAANHDVDRMHSDIDRIENAAETMARLLDDLLELSRLGHVAHEPETLPLGELVHDASELVAQQIAERGVDLDVASDLPVVLVDRRQFLEVFQNLIENAVKFMGDQGSPRIEIGVRPEEPRAIIYVRDNGIGVEPRFHEQIFGLFNRLDQSAQGTGVGLALVRRIIEIHGGRIWVESEGTGHGTTFCFTVPLAPRNDQRRMGR